MIDLHAIDTTILAGQEPCIDFKQKGQNQELKYAYMKKYKNSRTTTTCSRVPAAKGTYLPGGALLTTFGQVGGRVIESGSDPLGRWAWQKVIGKDGKIIQIISAYRVSQTSMPGPTTAYTQQYKMLQDMDHSDPHPKNQFIIDLTHHLGKAKTNKEEIILALDANEEILQDGVPGPTHSITTLKDSANLTDVFSFQHDNVGDTSRRSTKKIDHVLISPSLLKAVKHSGFLPWNQIMESDHRTGFVDFDAESLFGKDTDDPTSAYARRLSTDYPEAIEKYLQLLNEKVSKSHIVSAIAKLNKRAQKHGWTPNRERDYNNIDAQLTDMMLAAEKECVPKISNTSKWSTNLEVATRAIRYWNLRISKYKKQKGNEAILKQELQAGNVTDNTQTEQEATNKRAEAWRHLRKF